MMKKKEDEKTTKPEREINTTGGEAREQR